ncbi:MAG: glycosyltransferase, partial [Burkholderiales bacterium]|nr:glycosyltransferase [Burkholderiales bacterium]
MAGAIVDDARVSPLVRSLALRLRAEARGLLGDPAAALDDARRAAELVPGDARAWNALGIAAADAGEHADAVEAFSRAASVDATYARAWNNLGNALRT